MRFRDSQHSHGARRRRSRHGNDLGRGATVSGGAREMERAKTIIWNGPLGVFEMSPFAGGTQTLAEAIAASDAFSIAGGGDTLAAIEQFGVTDAISYISTGGGAFLEFVEGKTLPAIAALEALTEKGD